MEPCFLARLVVGFAMVVISTAGNKGVLNSLVDCSLVSVWLIDCAVKHVLSKGNFSIRAFESQQFITFGARIRSLFTPAVININ